MVLEAVRAPEDQAMAEGMDLVAQPMPVPVPARAVVLAAVPVDSNPVRVTVATSRAGPVVTTPINNHLRVMPHHKATVISRQHPMEHPPSPGMITISPETVLVSSIIPVRVILKDRRPAITATPGMATDTRLRDIGMTIIATETVENRVVFPIP